MGFLAVIAAAVASFVFGSIWYMSLAKPWMAASGVDLDENGNPANRSNPVPYITSFLCALLVAGMMRHVFGAGWYRHVWQRDCGRIWHRPFPVRAMARDQLRLCRATVPADVDRRRIRSFWLHGDRRSPDVILKKEGSDLNRPEPSFTLTRTPRSHHT